MNPYEMADNRNVGLFGLLNQATDFAGKLLPIIRGTNNAANQTPGNPVQQQIAAESRLPEWVKPVAIGTGVLVALGLGYLIIKKA